MPLVLCCRACTTQQHKDCIGTPEQGTCHCRQCWTRHIMSWAQRVMDSNNHGEIRAALKAVYAIQVQTQLQRQRTAYRQPAILYCAGCGSPVSVRRRPKLGQPVYCRDKSTCKWRAWAARRQPEQAVRDQPQTASQIPEDPIKAGGGQDQVPEPGGADLWLAMHRL
jgi:hypothetical protein